MKYLIKDLARISGLQPARIRKWQERYSFLRPTQGSNGYYYYSNDDLFILKNIATELQTGKTISKILAAGRDQLLHPPSQEKFSKREWRLLRVVSANRFEVLDRFLSLRLRQMPFRPWIARELVPLLVLVGRGWEENLISVADEHAFSRWFTGYFQRVLQFRYRSPKRSEESAEILVACFPGDKHELGAMLFSGKLISRGIPVKFVGTLPEEELTRELGRLPYRYLCLSSVLPPGTSQLQNLCRRLGARFPGLSIHLGGSGQSFPRQCRLQKTGT